MSHTITIQPMASAPPPYSAVMAEAELPAYAPEVINTQPTDVRSLTNAQEEAEERKRRRRQEECCCDPYNADEDGWFIYCLCRSFCNPCRQLCRALAECTDDCCEICADTLHTSCDPPDNATPNAGRRVCCDGNNGCCEGNEGCCDGNEGCCEGDGGCCVNTDTAGGTIGGGDSGGSGCCDGDGECCDGDDGGCDCDCFS